MSSNNAYVKNLYCSFDGVDQQRRVVSGIFTDDLVDMQGHLIERAGMEEAIAEYRQWGNVREMHDKPVGVAETIGVGVHGADGWNRISARIVSDSAWDLVKGGVYRGFSIGAIVHDGDIVPVKEIPSEKFAGLSDTIRKSIEDFGFVFVVTKLSLIEVSVVDRPANPRAVFTSKGLGSGDVMALPGFADGGFGAIKSALQKGMDSGVQLAASLKKEKMMEDIVIKDASDEVEVVVEVDELVDLGEAEEADVEVVDDDNSSGDDVVEDEPEVIDDDPADEVEDDVVESEVELGMEPEQPEESQDVDLSEIVEEMTKKINVLIEAVDSLSKKIDGAAEDGGDDANEALVQKIVEALKDARVVRKSAVYSADEEYEDEIEPINLKTLGSDDLLDMIVKGVAKRAQ